MEQKKQNKFHSNWSRGKPPPHQQDQETQAPNTRLLRSFQASLSPSVFLGSVHETTEKEMLSMFKSVRKKGERRYSKEENR